MECGKYIVVVVDVVCFLSSVCLSETVYLHEEVLYIFLLDLILSILESNSDRGIFWLSCSTK